MPSEHRDVLQQVRVESAQALHQHRQALAPRSTAKSVLAAERSRTQRARTQYLRDLAAARVDAHGAAHLLRFLDRHLKKAA